MNDGACNSPNRNTSGGKERDVTHSICLEYGQPLSGMFENG